MLEQAHEGLLTALTVPGEEAYAPRREPTQARTRVAELLREAARLVAVAERLVAEAGALRSEHEIGPLL